MDDAAIFEPPWLGREVAANRLVIQALKMRIEAAIRLCDEEAAESAHDLLIETEHRVRVMQGYDAGFAKERTSDIVLTKPRELQCRG